MAELVRVRLREGYQCRLRGVVDGLGRLVLERVRTGDVHDGSRRVTLDPQPDDVLHQHHRRPNVDREGRVEVLGGDVERVLIGLQTGVVDQHVDATQQVGGGGHDGPHLFGVGEIGGMDRQAIHVGMGVTHLREFLTEHVGRQHPSAFVQEGVHDATPDPAGASRHDHSSPFEPHRRVRPFLVVGADGQR